MRIALVGAEFEENLSLRTIHAALLERGHQVELLAFNGAAELDRVANRLLSLDPELVGLSMVFTARSREFAELASRARSLGLRAHLTAGGHFAAFHPAELLREVQALDSVVCGEGELILSELVRNLHDPRKVAGLVWRKADGSVVRNPPATKPTDLDGLPTTTHKSPMDEFLGLPIVNLLGSRGCAYHCSYCSIAAWHRLCGGPRLRCRAPRAIAREMGDLYRQGARIFNFHDDNFLLRNEAERLARIDQLRHQLSGEQLGRIAIAIKARPDAITERSLALLKRLGLFRVFLGIEAGSSASLGGLGRAQSVEDNERALALTDRFELHVCYNLLLFDPGSTLESFVGTVEFLRRHPQHPMNFCRTEIYAGTPLATRLEHEGRLLGDFWGYDYRIADPRAQLLSEIVGPVFRHRNYGQGGLHHRAMAVDYEHQLLCHFWGTDTDLRRRVKLWIEEVNLNTAGHLGAMARAVQNGVIDPTDLAGSVSGFAAKVEDDSARLGTVAQHLLREIRARALPRGAERGRPWVRRATAAGVAASLTIATGCKKKSSSEGEIGTHVFETVAAPIYGDPALVREQLRAQLDRIVARLTAPCRLEIELALGPSGQISLCTARDLDQDRRFDCPTLDLTIERREAKGRRFRVEFSRAEVADVAARLAGRDAAAH